MRGDDLVCPLRAFGGAAQLLAVHAGDVADAVGDAETAACKTFADAVRHGVDLRLGRGGVFVPSARLLAKPAVPRKHGDVHRRAVTVHDVEVVRGMVFVLAAVAGDCRRHAHAQHAAEDRLLGIAVKGAVRQDGILVHVDIEKAGADDPAGGVDHAVCLRNVLRHGYDAAVLHEDVQARVDSRCGIDKHSVSDQGFHIRYQPLHIILSAKLPLPAREIKS